MLVPYAVVIDGKKRARLRNGKAISIPLNNGEHTIQVVVQGNKTAEQKFDLEGDKDVVYECGPSGAKKVLIPWQSSGKAPWLGLHRID
jgi:hypothetical protein